MKRYNGIKRPAHLADAILREMQDNGIEIENFGVCAVLAEGNDLGEFDINVITDFTDFGYEDMRSMEGYGYAFVGCIWDVHEYAASQFPEKFYLYD